MRTSRSSAGSMSDDETLALCILVRMAAAIVGTAVLARGDLGGDAWMAIGAGVAYGVMAPGQWGMAIKGAAAASIAALVFPGNGAPAIALLVLPGAVAGSWLRPRPEAVQPVPRIDAVLVGVVSEAVFAVGMVMAAFLSVATGAVLTLLCRGLGAPVAMMLMALAAGWMHVAYGRLIHGMLPRRFGAFALGQALPITLLALAAGEPGMLLVAAVRGAFLWAGHLMADMAPTEIAPAPPATADGSGGRDPVEIGPAPPATAGGSEEADPVEIEPARSAVGGSGAAADAERVSAEGSVR